MRVRPSLGWSLYAALVASSALLTLTGGHRALYASMRRAALPPLADAALGGLSNLSWSEFAYVLARRLGSVPLFELLPIAASGFALIGAGLLLAGHRRGRDLLLLNLIGGSVAGAVVVAGLGMLAVAGHGADQWRLVNAAAFLLAQLAWLVGFRGTLVERLRGSGRLRLIRPRPARSGTATGSRRAG